MVVHVFRVYAVDYDFRVHGYYDTKVGGWHGRNSIFNENFCSTFLIVVIKEIQLESIVYSSAKPDDTELYLCKRF